MDKLSYALGLSFGQRMTLQLGVRNLNFDDFLHGVKVMFGEEMCEINPDDANKVLKKHLENFQEERKKIEKYELQHALEQGQEYMENNAKNEGVKSTESGLQYRVIKEGEGLFRPSPHSRVMIHYEGRLTGGTVLDSSYQRNTPAEISLEQVIPGWSEGLQLMTEGSVYEFTIPANLGYGEVGVPGHIPGNSVLVFKVELIKIL